jgi:hypothetical protein
MPEATPVVLAVRNLVSGNDEIMTFGILHAGVISGLTDVQSVQGIIPFVVHDRHVARCSQADAGAITLRENMANKRVARIACLDPYAVVVVVRRGVLDAEIG